MNIRSTSKALSLALIFSLAAAPFALIADPAGPTEVGDLSQQDGFFARQKNNFDSKLASAREAVQGSFAKQEQAPVQPEVMTEVIKTEDGKTIISETPVEQPGMFRKAYDTTKDAVGTTWGYTTGAARKTWDGIKAAPATVATFAKNNWKAAGCGFGAGVTLGLATDVYAPVKNKVVAGYNKTKDAWNKAGWKTKTAAVVIPAAAATFVAYKYGAACLPYADTVGATLAYAPAQAYEYAIANPAKAITFGLSAAAGYAAEKGVKALVLTEEEAAEKAETPVEVTVADPGTTSTNVHQVKTTTTVETTEDPIIQAARKAKSEGKCKFALRDKNGKMNRYSVRTVLSSKIK